MNDFPSIFQNVVYTRTYARWDYDHQRREFYPESVSRYLGFLWTDVIMPRIESGMIAEPFWRQLMSDAEQQMLNLGSMGSMRAFWSAGKALREENACAYNCAYLLIEIQTLKDFAEVLYLLMCGCGVSYSCERQFITKLPTIPKLVADDFTIIFADSKYGWAEGFYKLLQTLAKGYIPKCDFSKLRPAGTILKTYGGRSSGPEPLKELVVFTINLFKAFQGNKLTSDAVSDLCCKIADIVVVGGARRSATLALSNPSDRRMAEYKKGEYWHEHGYRAMVNVSSCYTDKPGVLPFLDDVKHLIESRSGERGFINRDALIQQLELLGRPVHPGVGVNPCAEIILQPKQFCNLSEVVVRHGDTVYDLEAKVKTAVVLGFLQSTLTNFNFISTKWATNCIDDRILGLSLTGIRDHEILRFASEESATILRHLRGVAHEFEARLAQDFGIPPAKAITCVKPSGTVSKLVDSASGLHVRYAKYYIQRIRMTVNDPLAKLLIAQGVPWSPENGETVETCRTIVFSFPIKAPEGAVVKADVTAIGQLEYWKMLKVCWCDHNPSCTIYVKEHEWVSVAAWVYENFDILSGVSFLPDDNNYSQAPYEELSEEEYETMLAALPNVDLSALSDYEKEDYTTGSHESACTGGACELV
jgi:ribonucleoside-diphosphate reductase alpha chain